MSDHPHCLQVVQELEPALAAAANAGNKEALTDVRMEGQGLLLDLYSRCAVCKQEAGLA